MKTAKIVVHHVFGTNAMLEKAKEYAFGNGFTHIRVEY